LLYKQYHKKIMAICIRYLKDKEQSFEIMNESFMKIFDKIHLYKSEINFEAWISRITINTIIDFIRKNKHYKQNFITTDEFRIYGEPDDAEGEIDEWWEEALSIPSDVLFGLIQELPPSTRIVFNLYAIDELTHKEIARQLNITEGTSKWHLSNPRKILKEKLSEIISKKNNCYDLRKEKKH
ncbi:MAG: RNA polymerase sigma factor, partial [Bacteroidetes bacterium]